MTTRILTTTNISQIQNFTRRRILQGLTLLLLVFMAVGYTLNLPLILQFMADSSIWSKYQPVLAEIGLPSNFLVLYLVFWRAGAVYLIICNAFFILWRRSNDWVVMLTSLFMVGFIMSYGVYPSNAVFCFPATSLLIGLGAAVVLWVFPNGQFVPRWLRWWMVPHWLLTLPIVISLTNLTTNRATMLEDTSNLSLGYLILMMGGSVFAQLYRFRYHSTSVEKQQTKWFMLGLLLMTVVLFGTLSLQLLIPLLRTPLIYANQTTYALPSLLFLLIWSPIAYGGFFLATLTVTFAMLRYRLWDVDTTLHRSLVYGIVAGFIGLLFMVVLYVRLVLFSTTFDVTETLLLMGITLLISLMIANPLKNTVQHWLDRHVFKLRFDLNQLQAGQEQPLITNPGYYTGRKLGEYELQEVIGRGGMGEVYRGVAPGKQAAIKVMPPLLASSKELYDRMEREAQAMQRLQHPGIVRCYDYGTTQGITYLALEYIEGRELKDLLQEYGRLSLETVREILRSLGAALEYAHQQGIVHRDLKPANIMLRTCDKQETYQAVLMDFGVAYLQDATRSLTGMGAVGTIDYMAPEQILELKTVDQRADIYALGVLLYEKITGEKPFKGSPSHVMFAHLNQPAPDPRSVCADIDTNTAKVITRALAKNPEDRFASVLDLVQALTP